MALDTITPAAAVFGTLSANLVGTGTSVASTDTFVADVKFNPNVMFIIEGSGGASTVTINAPTGGFGVNPPSPLGILGNKTIAIGSGEVRYWIPTPGQYIQADGTFTGSNTGNTVRIRVVQFPRGVSGGV